MSNFTHLTFTLSLFDVNWNKSGTYLWTIFQCKSLEFLYIDHLDLSLFCVTNNGDTDLEEVVFTLLLPTRINRRSLEDDVMAFGLLCNHHVFLEQASTISPPQTHFVVSAEAACQVVFEAMQDKIAMFIWRILTSDVFCVFA